MPKTEAKVKLEEDPLQNKLDEQAAKRAFSFSQPIIQKSPELVKKAMDDQKTSVAVFTKLDNGDVKGAVNTVVNYINPPMSKRASVEAETSDFFKLNQNKLTKNYDISYNDTLSDNIIKNPEQQQESLKIASEREKKLINLNRAHEGEILFDVAQDCEKKQKGFLEHNGDQFFKDANKAGFNLDTILSVASFLDGVYGTNLAPNVITNNAAQLSDLIMDINDRARELQDKINNPRSEDDELEKRKLTDLERKLEKVLGSESAEELKSSNYSDGKAQDLINKIISENNSPVSAEVRVTDLKNKLAAVPRKLV